MILSELTAQKTIFPKPWNIMESSKRPSKYYLSINFLAEKRPSHHRKIQNKNFSVKSSFYQLFGSKKDRIFHLQKFRNKNFLVTSKHGIPY